MATSFYRVLPSFTEFSAAKLGPDSSHRNLIRSIFFSELENDSPAPRFAKNAFRETHSPKTPSGNGPAKPVSAQGDWSIARIRRADIVLGALDVVERDKLFFFGGGGWGGFFPFCFLFPVFLLTELWASRGGGWRTEMSENAEKTTTTTTTTTTTKQMDYLKVFPSLCFVSKTTTLNKRFSIQRRWPRSVGRDPPVWETPVFFSSRTRFDEPILERIGKKS